MPIVQARCTNCSANLQIDNTKDAAICPYCGTPYVVEKAINYFNTTNHISANVVNIYGGNSADFEITGGVLKKYNGASTDVVIPNSVTSILANAFKMGKNDELSNSSLTSIYIPDSVSNIPLGTFLGCAGLRKIRWPESWKGRIRDKIIISSAASFNRIIDRNTFGINFACTHNHNVCLLLYHVPRFDTEIIILLEKELYINGINENNNTILKPYEMSWRSNSLREIQADLETHKIFLERMLSLADIGVQSVEVISVPNFVTKTKPIIKKDYVAVEGEIKALQITLPYLDS